MGLHPSRLFPAGEVAGSSPVHSPPGVIRAASRGRSLSRLQGVAPDDSPFLTRPVLRGLAPGRCPLGLFPLQGSASMPWVGVLQLLPSDASGFVQSSGCQEKFLVPRWAALERQESSRPNTRSRTNHSRTVPERRPWWTVPLRRRQKCPQRSRLPVPDPEGSGRGARSRALFRGSESGKPRSAGANPDSLADESREGLKTSERPLPSTGVPRSLASSDSPSGSLPDCLGSTTGRTLRRADVLYDGLRPPGRDQRFARSSSRRSGLFAVGPAVQGVGAQGGCLVIVGGDAMVFLLGLLGAPPEVP